MTIGILAGCFLLLMFLGMPVAFAMGVPAIAYLFTSGGSDLAYSFIPHAMNGPFMNFVMIALPAYLFLGRLMGNCGVTDRLLNFAVALVGRFKGGLVYGNILCSLMFASMSGTAVGDAGGLGLVEIEMMDKAGYRKAFSAGITGASSVLGPLIPPSVVMVLLGASSQISIGKLFMGGLVPGTIMAWSLFVHVFLKGKTTEEGRNWPVTRVPAREVLKATGKAFFSTIDASDYHRRDYERLCDAYRGSCHCQ